MWKLECFVDDKRHAAVHQALAGIGVYELKTTLVTNAKPTKGGKLKSTAPEEGIDTFIRNYLNKSKSPKTSAIAIRDTVVNAGWSKSSHYPIISRLITQKVWQEH